MKKLISFIVSLCMVCVMIPCNFVVYAESTSGSCGTNVTWSYDNNGTLTISGTGKMADYGTETSVSADAPWKIYSNSITTVNVGDGITYIGANAFSDMNKIATISLPNSLTEIGWTAFGWCYNLETINLPAGLITIGGIAFYQNHSLSSVTIPDSVISIGKSAFARCISLAAINVADGNSNYKSVNGALYSKDGSILIQYPAGKIGDFTITENVRTVADGEAFACAYGLTSLTIPESLENFEPSFYFDTSLSAIIVAGNNSYFKSDEGVLYSKDGKTLIYYPAAKLSESFTVPDTVVTIGASCFHSTQYLKKVIIPSSTLYFAGYDNNLSDAFYSGYNSVKTISGIIGSAAHEASYVFNLNFEPLTGTIPENSCGVSSTWSYDSQTKTFSISGTGKVSYQKKWDNIKSEIESVVIANGITELKNSFFRDWSHLLAVSLPDSIVSVEGESFNGCTSLASIYIGKGVVNLGSGSKFNYCKSLKTIYVSSENNYYHISNGALYKGATLCLYPSVTDVENVIVPNGTNMIGSFGWAFFNTSGIRTMYIPKTVTKIWDLGVYNLNDLETIYYEGTEEEYASLYYDYISNDVYTTNFPTANVVYNYSLTDYQNNIMNPDLSASLVFANKADARSVKVGKTFDLNLMVDNNPGYTNATYAISYDNTVLELVSVTTNTDFGNVTVNSNIATNPYNIIWTHETSDVTVTGQAATLKFKVASDTDAGNYHVTLSAVSAFNTLNKPVSMIANSTSVNVTEFIYGDADNSGSVNALDATYILKNLVGESGYTEFAYQTAADVDGYTGITANDAIAILRHIAEIDGYDVLPLEVSNNE